MCMSMHIQCNCTYISIACLLYLGISRESPWTFASTDNRIFCTIQVVFASADIIHTNTNSCKM